LLIGADIVAREAISNVASFFLNGVSLILVLIRIRPFSVGDEAIVKDRTGPFESSFVLRLRIEYCPAL
jgi:hypothetical protein